jgi:hypothetical protein
MPTIKVMVEVSDGSYYSQQFSTCHTIADSCQESFDTLKRALTTAPILGYPTCEDKFIIDCDASNDGMGGVLSQVQIGTEKVICYFSRATT